MRHKYPYLTNTSFLMELFREQVLEHYVKFTVLNFDEKPLKEIQGKVTAGNINVDGNSSVRRTANLTAFIDPEEASYLEIGGLFSLNKKIKLEIGIKNTTNHYSECPIFWFPQGVYVIIAASTSHNISGTTISLQLKDKMCLLNGECGGVIPASTVFHEYEEYDPTAGDYTITRPTMVQIIRELVNHFGGEQLGKIFINDLDTRVRQVMKWTGDTPLYFYNTSEDGNSKESYFSTYQEGSLKPKEVYENGQDVGYIYTDFCVPYNTEIIGDAGSNVCTILDQIKGILGNYEYFYDLDGNFVFQEVKNYLNTSKSTVDLNNMHNSDYLLNKHNGAAVYVFNDSHIITAYSNAPQYNNVKNDFIVWGLRETTEGKQLPIRYHLAIDSKPRTGHKYELCKVKYIDPATREEVVKYQKYIVIEVDKNFPDSGQIDTIYYDESIGQCYIWNPKAVHIIDPRREWKVPHTKRRVGDGETGTLICESNYHKVDGTIEKITAKDWRTELYLAGANTTRFGNDSNYYYTELINEWPKLYDISKGEFYQDTIDYPERLDYFLDFIDTDAAISEISVSNIGRRTHVVNDDKINCLFEREIPNYILIDAIADGEEDTAKKEADARGDDWIQVNSQIYSKLALGGSQNSAYNLIKDLLYQYTGYNESITIQSLPLYFISNPNIRITVRDKDSGINGDYMLNNFSIPLDVNGTMSMSCSRVLERI